MGYSGKTRSSIDNNNLKLTADKIILILDQVREEGKKSKRRWIWELMQNAKDVSNIFGKVSIEIKLTENELIFSHNGDAFTIDNLTGIVQQVSSKSSNNKDKNITGKFGTGFIATHLLSDIITIEGVLQEPEELAKTFTLKLDRSGKTSEELIPSIGDALDVLSDIENDPNFITLSDYEKNRNENHYLNKFIYKLESDALKTAQIGLDDLVTTLPVALVFLKSIKQVKIIDEVNNTNLLYKLENPLVISSEFEETSISIYNELTSEFLIPKNFILKTNNEIQLLAEVDDFVNYELISVSKNQPFLYRDFPLIGTEQFYFPFILNGKTFNPTEKRDGIYLNGNSEKVNHNKEILAKSIEHSLELVDFLLSKKAKKLFNVCLSSLPAYNFESEDNTKEWYEHSIQKRYRNQLTDKKIVGKNDENYCLKEIRFPTSNEKDYPELRGLITEYLGENRVPFIDEQEKWILFLGPHDEMKTWELELSYGINDLASDIDKEVNFLENTKIENKFDWLNRLYIALDFLNENVLHSSFKLVPNHYGQLRKLSLLYLEELSDDDKSYLPIPFLDLNKSLGSDWYSDLINREIKINKESHQKRNMSELNTSINNFFRADGFIHKEYALNHLLIVHSIVTPNSKEDSFQRLILNTANELFKKDEILTFEEYASKYNYEIVHRLLLQTINIQLEKVANLDNLSIELSKNKDSSTIWLDKYLSLLDGKNDYSKFLKEGKIFPNRDSFNTFCNYDDILNYGVEYQPLNETLLKILSKLNKEKDYFSKLLADGISIKMPQTLNFEKLGNEVIYEVEKIDREKHYENHREALLQLIDWIESNQSLTTKYASKLSTLSGRIFYILTIENSSSRESVMKILRNPEKINALAKLAENPIMLYQMEQLAKLFPEGIPEKVLDFAIEESRIKKDFNNLLEVGSQVERLFVELLSEYEVTNDIIHAGGGSYDIRIYNSETKKSFLIELKSCHYKNSNPINLAVSQVKRAVKELDTGIFSIVIIERSQNNEMDSEYIKSNTKYLRNPGQYLGEIADKFDVIDNSANTDEVVDLKMSKAEFKGSLDYDWVLEQIGDNGFDELLIDINNAISNQN